MPAVYDNWGRLFEAVQRRQQYLEMAHALSRNTSTASSISLDFDELSLSLSTEESNGGSTSGSNSTPGPSRDGSRDRKTLLSSLLNVKNSWWLSRSNKTGGKSGLLWYKDISQHLVGDFSMAIVQANNIMEDQSQIESGSLSLLDSGPHGTFVGVYDGHGGLEASRYINDHLFQNLKKFTAYHNSMSVDIIKNAFRATEEGFLSVVTEQWPLKPQLASVGSCCLVGVICNGSLYIANLGDPRAVLGRVVGSNVIAVPLCTEHTANIESVREELRSMHPDDPQILVLKHGVWRVKGIITVTRAIGDVYLKKPEFNKEPLYAKFQLSEPMKRPILSAEPSISVRQLEPHDKFVIFASDGLWEFLSNQEAVQIVQKQPRHGSARRLVRAALQEAAKKREIKYSHLAKIDRGVRRHFHDDITVIVLFLDSNLIDRGSTLTGPTLSMRGGEVREPIFNAVTDVDPSRSDWAIKVRIVRMYVNPEYKNPTETASLEMICVDQWGARIHGSVNSSLLKTFQPKLHEGNIYIIRHFLVLDNLMTYKTASHKYRFNFIARTHLIEDGDPSFPRQMYVFKPFSEILAAQDVEEAHLIDVIGVVVAKDAPRVEDLDGHTSTLIDVVLEDLEKNKVSCELRGEYVDELTKFFETDSHEPVIVLLQLCRALKFRGEVKISNDFYVMKMLVNEPINEITEFRDRLLLGRDITSLPRISQMPSKYKYTIADDLESRSTEFKTIEQLQALSKVGFFWVYGTILNVENVHDWWYLSCKKCPWKVVSVGRQFYCEKCNRWDETGNPSFRLQVRVMDDNSNTSLLISDRESTQLVRRTSTGLRSDMMGGSDLCPVEILALMGKNVLFKVQVKEENFNEEHSDVYSVVMLTDDPVLITKYVDIANTERQESDLFWELAKTDVEEMKDASDQE